MAVDNPTEEAPRGEPNFRAYVERAGQRTDITHAVMDVYDVAINSLDFGSGFLSTEEVGHLRALGKAIGADRFDYQHDKCLRCGHDYDRHLDRSDVAKCYATGCACTGFARPE